MLFLPSGASDVEYRGEVSSGPEAPPVGTYPLGLRYDPEGGDNFKPMQWCIDPQFDAGQKVISATLPAGESWCVASAYTKANSEGDLVTAYQVYGVDDPKIDPLS